ncbi:MAG: hypothetical protein ACRCYU_10350, partial [Nocardioides sp.]
MSGEHYLPGGINDTFSPGQPGLYDSKVRTYDPNSMDVGGNATGVPQGSALALIYMILSGSPAAVATGGQTYFRVGGTVSDLARTVYSCRARYTTWNNTFSTPAYNADIELKANQVLTVGSTLRQAGLLVVSYASFLEGAQGRARSLESEYLSAKATHDAERSIAQTLNNGAAAATADNKFNSAEAQVLQKAQALVKEASEAAERVRSGLARLSAGLAYLYDGTPWDQRNATIAYTAGTATTLGLTGLAIAFPPLGVPLLVTSLAVTATVKGVQYTNDPSQFGKDMDWIGGIPRDPGRLFELTGIPGGAEAMRTGDAPAAYMNGLNTGSLPGMIYSAPGLAKGLWNAPGKINSYVRGGAHPALGKPGGQIPVRQWYQTNRAFGKTLEQWSRMNGGTPGAPPPKGFGSEGWGGNGGSPRRGGTPGLPDDGGVAVLESSSPTLAHLERSFAQPSASNVITPPASPPPIGLGPSASLQLPLKTGIITIPPMPGSNFTPSNSGLLLPPGITGDPIIPTDHTTTLPERQLVPVTTPNSPSSVPPVSSPLPYSPSSTDFAGTPVTPNTGLSSTPTSSPSTFGPSTPVSDPVAWNPPASTNATVDSPVTPATVSNPSVAAPVAPTTSPSVFPSTGVETPQTQIQPNQIQPDQTQPTQTGLPSAFSTSPSGTPGAVTPISSTPTVTQSSADVSQPPTTVTDQTPSQTIVPPVATTPSTVAPVTPVSTTNQVSAPTTQPGVSGTDLGSPTDGTGPDSPSLYGPSPVQALSTDGAVYDPAVPGSVPTASPDIAPSGAGPIGPIAYVPPIAGMPPSVAPVVPPMVAPPPAASAPFAGSSSSSSTGTPFRSIHDQALDAAT